MEGCHCPGSKNDIPEFVWLLLPAGQIIGHCAPGQRLSSKRTVLHVEQALSIESASQDVTGALLYPLIGIRVGEVAKPVAQPGGPAPNRLELLQGLKEGL